MCICGWEVCVGVLALGDLCEHVCGGVWVYVGTAQPATLLQILTYTYRHISSAFMGYKRILENGTIPHSLDHHSVFTGDVCLLSDQGCVLSEPV